MKRLLILPSFFLLNSLPASANPSELATNLQNSLTELRIPVEFIVTRDGSYIGAEEQAIAHRFYTEPSSIYKGDTYSPKNPVVTVSELTDTSVGIRVEFERSLIYKTTALASYSMPGKFISDIQCIFSSDFKWSCRYLFVDQNFGPRIWPNPIDEWNPEQILTFMGPNKAIMQSSVLSITTQLVESKL